MSIATSRVIAQLVADSAKVVGQQTVKAPVNFKKETPLTDGTGNNQADKIYGPVTRNLAAGANEELDLRGVLSDFYGDTVDLAAIKGFIIFTQSTNQGNIEIGGAASNAWVGLLKDATDKLILPPNSWIAGGSPLGGWAVVAGTGDLLRVENMDGSNAANYEICFLGV